MNKFLYVWRVLILIIGIICAFLCLFFPAVVESKIPGILVSALATSYMIFCFVYYKFFYK
jgi:hypothetical protein